MSPDPVPIEPSDLTVPPLLLVAEDDATLRLLITYRLKKEGYRIIEATDGRECLEQFQCHSPALILMDVVMPEMDGFDCCVELLKLNPGRQVPIIMLTNLDDQGSIDQALSVGVNDYVTKPIHWAILLQRIRRILETERAMMTLRKRNIEIEEINRRLETDYLHLRNLEVWRDELMHSLVHDLRTPLTSLMTGLQLTHMSSGLNPQQQETLELAIEGGEALTSLIDTILDTSKVEYSQLQLHRERIDPEHLVESAVQQVTHLTQSAEVMLTVQISDNLSSFWGDPTLLQRVLINLLSNAIRHTPHQGCITVSVTEEVGKSLLFSVTDTGCGIPNEALDLIFDKYVQLDVQEKRGSVGLGLSFSKKVIEAHQGQIWVESEINRGSTFFFRLPVFAGLEE